MPLGLLVEKKGPPACFSPLSSTASPFLDAENNPYSAARAPRSFPVLRSRHHKSIQPSSISAYHWVAGARPRYLKGGRRETTWTSQPSTLALTPTDNLESPNVHVSGPWEAGEPGENQKGPGSESKL